MKGKITIVLLSLALVFGMMAVSCDNGDFPDKETKDAASLVVYKDAGSNLPTNSLVGLPARYTAAELGPLLREQVKYPSTSNNLVPKYQIISVAYNPAKHGLADSDFAKIANKYAGLQILVQIERP
jgi:hypothetical protein